MNEFIMNIQSILKEYDMYLEIHIESSTIKFALYRIQNNIYNEYINTACIEEWNCGVTKINLEDVFKRIKNYLVAYDVIQKNKEI